MKRSWKQIMFCTIAPTSKEDFTPVSKLSWFKISLWIMLLIGIFFLISDQSVTLPDAGDLLPTTLLEQDTVATTAPADTTVALPAPTDNNIVSQDSSSTVTPPADSNATVQPKLTLVEQQRQARLAKQVAKKAFFKKMDAAKAAKDSARAIFEAKNK